MYYASVCVYKFRMCFWNYLTYVQISITVIKFDK